MLAGYPSCAGEAKRNADGTVLKFVHHSSDDEDDDEVNVDVGRSSGSLGGTGRAMSPDAARRGVASGPADVGKGAGSLGGGDAGRTSPSGRSLVSVMSMAK